MKRNLEQSFLFLRGSSLIVLKMKLLIIFLLFGILQSTASVYSQTHKLDIAIKNAALTDIFKEIEKNSEFTFLYGTEDVDEIKGIDLNADGKTVEEILDNCLESISLTYTVRDKLVIIRKDENKKPDQPLPEENEQQKKNIRGKVTDKNGEPLPGVNVVVSGTTIGTITDIEGNYSFEIPDNASEITFSFIGMEPKSVTIGNQEEINVILEPSNEAIDEVIVTALGIKKQVKALGYAAQEVGGEDLSAARDVNLTGFLTAKIAGVQVAKTAGGPTGSSSVTIRGNSSLTGNSQPLYVVDGVPIINNPKSSGGLWENEPDYGDGIGDINPEDVLSINVLKGPNASSLYGSRGANGVVLITTKSGSKRKGIGIEVNSNISIETINQIPKTQNEWGMGWEDQNIDGAELITIGNETYETYPSWNNYNWGPKLDGTRTVWDPYLLPGEEWRPLTLTPQPTNNIRDFYELGITNQNTVALSGGNEKTTGRVSLGNTLYKGIVPNHRVEKQSISARVTSQMTKFISFDAKINYMHDEGSQRPKLGYSKSSPSFVLSQMGRAVPLDFLKKYYEETGESGQFAGLNGVNPYYAVNEIINDDYRDRVMGYLSTTVNFTDWLSLMGRVGTDFYTEYREKYWPIGSIEKNTGEVGSDLLHFNDINADAILSANKKLSDHFSISTSVGASLLKQYRDRIQLKGSNLRAEGVAHISNANTTSIYQSTYDKEMQSVYFTGQLAYNDYLYLDVTGRNDWSSALGINSQSYFYPSVSTSFIFSDALGLKESILSFGKVRLSWAQVGNDSDPYLTKIGYTLYSEGINGQGFISTPEKVPLIDLKNELTESWEVGTDLRFFKNRVSIDATYYNGHTTNQIISAQIAMSSGYESVVINAGRIDNKGFEAILSVTPIQSANSFNWDLSFNYSKNENTVVELTEDIDSYGLSTYLGGNGNIAFNATVGHPFGDIVGNDTRKVPDGEYKGQYIVQPNGQYETDPEVSILGNIQPDWIGGLNNRFSYKGLSLNVLIDFVQGGEIFSFTKHEMTSRGSGIWTLEGRNGGILPGVIEIKDGAGNVTGYRPNDVAVNGQDYWLRRARGQANWFVLDGSYIMLREVLLSYRLKSSLLEKTPIEGATLSLVGRNLFYIEEHMEDMGISPESAPNTSASYAGYETFSLPSTRTFGLNVKLTF